MVVVTRLSAELARYGRAVSVESQHLIVIRGTSGSGNTTLARELQFAMGRGTANVGQDHLRCMVLREHDLPDADNIGLIAQTARYCLAIGYHVIVEGILHSGHHRSMLRELVEGHSGPTGEVVLDAHQTAQETLAAVRTHIDPVAPHPDVPGGRFLRPRMRPAAGLLHNSTPMPQSH